MTEIVRLGDIGRRFIVGSGGYDLSGETDLRLVFKFSDGTIVEKTTADTPAVEAPSTPITVDVDGVSTTFEADEYWSYLSESGLLSVVGDTTIHGEYVDGTPKDLSGDINTFSIVPRE